MWVIRQAWIKLGMGTTITTVGKTCKHRNLLGLNEMNAIKGNTEMTKIFLSSPLSHLLL